MSYPFFSLATFDLDEIKMAISEKPNESSVPITVILDNVRTPDNIGALTRVAAAIGCKKIISTKVCLYNCTYSSFFAKHDLRCAIASCKLRCAGANPFF